MHNKDIWTTNKEKTRPKKTAKTKFCEGKSERRGLSDMTKTVTKVNHLLVSRSTLMPLDYG